MGNCLEPVDPVAESIPRQMVLDASPIKNSNLPIIYVIGGPGSGKKTQSSKAAEKYGFLNISTAEILREEIAMRSEIGIAVAHIMMEGKLVPNDVMLELLKIRMINNINRTNGFLLSGFPKQIEQGKLFDREIKPADIVLFLNVRISVMEDRVAGRTIAEKKRFDYSIHETTERRIAMFEKLNEPIVRHYHKQLVVIDGEEDVPVVFENVCTAIDEMLRRRNEALESSIEDNRLSPRNSRENVL